MKAVPMTPFNLELCQILLKQTNSIDETARLMAVDFSNAKQGFKCWKDSIIYSINRKELVI